MISQRYKPTSPINIIGNKTNIDNIIKWINEWNNESNSKNKKKCLLVSGNSGIGKTLSIELILKSLNYNIIELSSDEERNKEYIINSIKPILQNTKTIFGKKNALVVNDLDCLNDYGFISALIECIKETKIPILCTCNDRYNQAFKTFANYCEDIKFKNPSTNDIYKFICPIIKSEKIQITEINAKILIENSNNDIRNILNNLCFYTNQSTIQTKKDTSQIGIFSMTTTMFSQLNDFEEKYKTFWLDSDLIPLMIHENYINNTIKSKDEEKTFDNLLNSSSSMSDVDIFQSDLENTNWELMPYIAVNCIKVTSSCHSKSQIKFPSFLSKTSTKNKKKRMIQDLSNKFSEYKLSYITFKLDYLNNILSILFERLFNDKTKGRITKFVVNCLNLNLVKEDIQENLFNLIIVCEKYEKYNYKLIDTKTKTAIGKWFAKIE
jgi:replication factor C subunit 1